MAVYRFRVSFEDQDDIYREIEVKSSQTFEYLHNAIQDAIGFDNSKEASFFISDSYWRKGEEITLRNQPGKKSMSKSKIAGYIEDPHQRILYYFDPEANWSFYIELLRITEEDGKAKYPKCARSVGAAPKQYKETTLPPPPEEEEDHNGENNSSLKEKERIFTSEESYDTPEKEGDVLIEGDEIAEEGEEASEFEDGQAEED